MARISYDDQTAAAYKPVREVPGDGKEQLRRAVQHAGHTSRTETRTNWLDLLVLR